MPEDEFFDAPLGGPPTAGEQPADVWQQLVLAGLVKEGGRSLTIKVYVVAGLPSNLRTRSDVSLKAEVVRRASDDSLDAFLAAYETLPAEAIPESWRKAAGRLESGYGLLPTVARAAVALALFNLR